MSKSGIDEIVLVGGSSRIPKIQQMVQEFFNGKELNKTINLDEAVVYGAAIQVANMTNVKDEILENFSLLDVTPFSLGIETIGGVMDVLIPRNSTLPNKEINLPKNGNTYETKIFSMGNDYDSFFLVKVYEGEEQLNRNNHLLGKFIIDGIPPMPKEQCNLIITFDIDANSIFTVEAVEFSTGQRKKFVITNEQSRLSKDDIDRCIKKAEKFKDEDDKERDRIKAKNNLEQYLYLVRQTIKEERLKDKFYEEDKKQIENKIDEVLNFVNDNPDALKEEYNEKVKEIEEVFNPIKEKINQ